MKTGSLRRYIFISLVLPAFINLSFPGLSPARDAASIAPARLHCEYKKDPLGIDIKEPRLSWIVESDSRGQAQSAYRILVASSRENLDLDLGDLWDTRRVESDRTTHVVYRGAALQSHQQCFWKVMVWDRKGRASAWSEPAAWSMGLLDPGDWEAKWIGHDTPATEIHDLYLHLPYPLHWSLKMRVPGFYGTHRIMKGGSIKIYLPCPYLRAGFKARGPVRRAVVYATALGVYELHINGQRVGADFFTPGWSDYEKRVYYHTYDVTGLIRPGDFNVLGAILSDGWYAGNVNMHGQRYYGSKLRLRAQLRIEYEDGTVEVVATDGSWRASRGPILEADMQAGESYDARLEMPGWSSPGFDDKCWKPVEVTDNVISRVEAYPGIPVRRIMEIKPVEVAEPKPGVFVFNMGQNFAGWARLRVKGQAGDKVVMRFGEMRNPDRTVYTKNLRTARATDTYILKGGGEETWEPRFTYHGFQYVEVTGFPGEPTQDSITGIVAHSDLSVTGSLETSHPLVNRLYRNITWGQRSNYFEVPTDCPQRDERLGWTGDAQIFIRTATYNMDVAPFFTKWMKDLVDGQDDQGRFPDVAPNVLSGAAAGWGDAGIICPYTIYLVYGDTRILERHYEAMARYLNFLDRRAINNISPPLGTYGDWVNIKDPTPLDLVTTAYHGYDAGLMAQIARALGRDGDAKKYEERFEDIKAAFSKTFVSDQGGIKGDSQTAYLMGLGFDLLPGDRRQQAADRLLNRIEARDWCLSTGFLGLKMLLPTLTQIGRNDVAYRLLTNTRYPSWGYSIEQGATTVWERWNSYTKEEGFGPVTMNSFNHYAFGSVGEWMFHTMAGIDTEVPGFKRIKIRPRPGGDITWVKASYDSIRGRIEVDWKREGEMFYLNVSIPANTTALVYVPVERPELVMESEGPALKAASVKFLRAEAGCSIFEVGSGSYLFSGPTSGR